ncbi:MAG: hypothetical protein WC644_01805 [Ignavibacteria bacterium]
MGFLKYFKREILKELTCQYNVFERDDDKGSKIFLQLIKEYREKYLTFAENNKLNHSSFGGILIEWIFKFALDVCVENLNKSDKIEIINKYQLDCPWKTKGHKKVNIDLLIKVKNSNILLMCAEMKTNFEDGFEKYFVEQENISKIESIKYQKFKYHYISLSRMPPKFSTREELRNKIETLNKNSQLWILQIINTQEAEFSEDLIKACSGMLNSFYSVIKDYK